MGSKLALARSQTMPSVKDALGYGPDEFSACGGGHLNLITVPMPMTIRNINANRDCAIDAIELFFSVFGSAKQTL